MRWWWRKPAPVPIPPYHPPIAREHAPKDDGIEVTEVDTSDMTKTGVFRAFTQLAGKKPPR